MNVLYFDCFSGIAGDMCIGALLDLGLSFDELRSGLGALAIPGCKLEQRRVKKSGLMACKFDVIIEDKDSVNHRHLTDILAMIAASTLPAAVKSTSSAVFRVLGEAEAKVHGIPVEDVHFHEVGAIDSIVDIVGTCLGLHLLGVSRIYASPVHIGLGAIRSDHGLFPGPGPATMELLRGMPLYSRGLPQELTTPTGAALLRGLGAVVGEFPNITLESVGYGAGTIDLPHPNVLRALLGTVKHEHESTSDQVVLLETNIDTMTGEQLGHLSQLLLDRGALDVWTTAISMKKQRPGVLLSVLCEHTSEEAMQRLLFKEALTLGLRRQCLERTKLHREEHVITTQYGDISVKLGKLAGKVLHARPEFEDCKSAAHKHQIPLHIVQDEVMHAIAAFIAQKEATCAP